jgi:hypothetical protein
MIVTHALMLFAVMCGSHAKPADVAKCRMEMAACYRQPLTPPGTAEQRLDSCVDAQNKKDADAK